MCGQRSCGEDVPPITTGYQPGNSDMSQSTELPYGTSASLCDYVLIHQLAEMQPSHIVDFGAGGGKNGRLEPVLGIATRGKTN